ncbi:MAG: hydrogenase accessory protein HypB [Phycisphaeraceae bacterium]|nr:hydrogenase accessory protein HypB [Phycisphaeraceae bacterium]
MKVPIVENVLKLNDEIAAINRQTLRDADVFTIDLIGAPGCGKTSLLEVTLEELGGGPKRFGVLVGDLTTDRDAARMAERCDQVVQINTGKGCHLDANQVRQGLGNLDLDRIDVLFIENVGNLICPVGFDLGQDTKVGMFSISEGDDKAAKHPHLVHVAELLLLNKTDLLPHVDFDTDRFREDVRRLNPDVPLVELSVRNRSLQPWYAWLETAAGRIAIG